MYLKGVSRVFQRRSEGVSRQYEGVTRNSRWCFKKVKRVLQDRLKSIHQNNLFQTVPWASQLWFFTGPTRSTDGKELHF